MKKFLFSLLGYTVILTACTSSDESSNQETKTLKSEGIVTEMVSSSKYKDRIVVTYLAGENEYQTNEFPLEHKTFKKIKIGDKVGVYYKGEDIVSVDVTNSEIENQKDLIKD